MIFLTGASGLLGSHIARTLLAEGHQIRALYRKTSKLDHLRDIRDRIEWVEGDLLDTSLMARALQGCQQVVHCAGVVSYAKKDAELLYATNVEGTGVLVNAALAGGITRFVHMSSVAALGRPARRGLINEKQKWEKSAINSYYGETKYWGELEVWRGQTEGLNSIIFNPSVVLGPGPMDRSSTRLFKYVHQQKPFYPPGLINWVDVRDVARIVTAALQPGAPSGERFIISAGAVRYAELFRQMADCLGVKSPQYQINSVLSGGAYYLEKIKSIFGNKEPLITRETRILSNLEIEFENSKIIRHFGLHHTSLEETIRWCCQGLQPYLR